MLRAATVLLLTLALARAALAQDSVALRPPPSLQKVVVSGGYAYVADGWQRTLRVLDVRDPRRPSQAGASASTTDEFLRRGDTAGDVALHGQYAYHVVRSGRFAPIGVVDVSNPAAPARVGHVPSGSGFPTRATARDGYLYLTAAEAAGAPGVQLLIWSLADPRQATFLGNAGAIDQWNDVLRPAVDDGHAYVGGGLGLTVFDVREPARPARTATVALTVRIPPSVAATGDLVLVTSPTGAHVLDRTDRARPTVLAHTESPGVEPRVVVAGGGYAYLAGVGGLAVVDLAIPSRPRVVGTLRYPDAEFWDLALDGSTLFAAAGQLGLRVVDVSAPALPTEIGSYVPARIWFPLLPQRA